MKNGKLPPGETVLKNYTAIVNESRSDINGSLNQTNVMDNLTESDSLEQDGVLVVNISSDNLLNFDELYPNIQIINVSNKMDEVTNKIQSNSREITGDTKNNISKLKDLENITVGPSPTNGVLSVDQESESDKKHERKVTLVEMEMNAMDMLLRPTENLQSLGEENVRRRKHRRRRHGNGRRYEKNYI